MTTWNAAADRLPLETGEVHLWRLDLNRNWNATARFEQTLSREELCTAHRFRVQRHRHRFVLAHGGLRDILSRYVSKRPRDLLFNGDTGGKPWLESGEVVFNMSHSDDLVLYAISRTCDVGVDVERVRPGVAEEIINHFVPDATQYLGTLSPAARQRVFYQGWTRMEAYVKGRGTGLRASLEDLPSFLGKWPAHEWSRDGSGEVGHWSLLDLSPRVGYVGALVVNHVDCRVRFWRWQVEAHAPIISRDSDISIDNSYQTGP